MHAVLNKIDRADVDALSYLDECTDVDSHEMAPVHLWPEMFGEIGREFAKLAERMEIFQQGGSNQLLRPDISGDNASINKESVWNDKGPAAPGAFDMHRRAEVMSAMGVARQLVFPGFGFVGLVLAYNPRALEIKGFDITTIDTIALSKRVIQAHNDWCLRVTKELGPRVRPVGLLLTDSVDQMMRDAHELIDGGIRAVMIPNGAPPAGLSPADAALDPFWDLFASSNVALTFHIGTETFLFRNQAWDMNVPAFQGYHTLEITIQPFRGCVLSFGSETYLTAMILGGVLERHPKLRLGSIEIGAQWVGPFAERLDLWAGQFSKRLSSVLKMRPSEYLNRQFRAAPFHFEDVASYFERYDNLQDVFAFATDYPHIEGGRSSKANFDGQLAGCSETVRRKFFKDNGLLLFPA